MQTYKIGVICSDGKAISFRMESNRRIVDGNRMCYSTNPLLGEVFEELLRRANDPKSKIHKHGGHGKIRYIENVNTGTFQPYDMRF